MKYKITILVILLFMGRIMFAQLPDLTQMEYYFDTDPGFGNGTQVGFTADSIIDVNFNADLSTIDIGYHKLFIRIKDENGKWSLIYKQGIYKAGTPSTSVPLPDLTQMEYYFDTDPGFGNGFQIPFSADSLVSVDFNADLSSVDIGYHKLFVRTKDENGKWSLIYKQGIYKAGTPSTSVPLPDLVQMEYYYDTDPGFGNGFQIPFSADSLVSVDFNADLSSVDIGYHKLFVRTKDENGKWSLIYKQGIYKAGTPSTSVPLPDLVQMEYYYDTDPGFGNGFQIPFSADSLVSVDFNADLSSVDVGYHKLFVRTKDENRKWSLIYKQGIYKAGTPSTSVPLPNLTQMEYYFDTDPGFGNGFQIPFAADSLVSVDFNADLSSVDIGYHKLFVRTKDENGKWSLIYKQGIYKAGTPTTHLPLPELTQMEYFFDLDPGFGLGTDVPFISDSLVDEDFNADMTALSVGTHQLFVRIKDENNKWSLIYTEEVEKVNANQWQGTIDTDWSNANNWQFDIPIATENVSIDENMPRYPEVNTGSTAECNHLLINPGGSLTIPIDNAITVSGDISVSGSLTIKSAASGSGSLIEDGTPMVTGSLTVERYVTAAQWHGISSPLSGTTANVFYLNGSPEVWLKEHNETSNAYSYITDLTTPLGDMKGFFIWIGDTEAKTFNMVGNLRSGVVGIDNNLARSAPGDNNGWNYVGNPFTSAIDWNATTGWTKTNVAATTYVYNYPNWATWNGNTGTNNGSRYIAMGQAFFVNVTEGNSVGTLKMDHDVMVHNNTPFLKQGEGTLNNLIRLELSGNGFADETVIWLGETATEGFDGDFDAHKLFSFNTDAPQVYSTANNYMAVNGLPISTTEVPLDVRGSNGMDMTMSLTENTGFGNVYLLDNHTGIQTDLTVEGYSFAYDAGITDRFTIYFTTVGLPNQSAKTFKIFAFQNDICVVVPKGQNAEIFVYNLTGQTVAHANGTSGMNKVRVNKKGCYVVKAMNGSGLETKKVFIE